MSREYVISSSNVSVAAATSMLYVRPPAAGIGIEILRLWVSQSATATGAQVRVIASTQAVSGSPAFTSFTPLKLKTGDPVSAITGGTAMAAGNAGINATTESGGAHTSILEDAFSNLTGWLWVPTPRETIIVQSGSNPFVLRFPTAPGTLTGWAFGCVYAELG